MDIMKFEPADFKDDRDYAGNDKLTPIVLKLVEERIAYAAKLQRISVKKFKNNKEAIRMMTKFVRSMVEDGKFKIVDDKDTIIRDTTIKQCIDEPETLEYCIECIRDTFKERDKYKHMSEALAAMY